LRVSQVYLELESIAKGFSDIVVDAKIMMRPSGEPLKLRIYLLDGSFLDVWLSISGKYSYHWERRHVDGKIYRHDNAPHSAWRRVKTFPRHFHEGEEKNVVESMISSEPREAIREFLRFIKGYFTRK